MNWLNPRLARRVLSLPPSEEIDPLRLPPWHQSEPLRQTLTRISAPGTRPKEQSALDFIAFSRTIPPSDISVYSDGSKDSITGSAGVGLVVFQADRVVSRQCFSLGYGADVFDAEAAAALAGIQAAVALPTARFASDLWLFTDNLEVAKRLLAEPTGQAQQTFESIISSAKTWPLRTRLPHTRPGSVRVRWVPSHSGISGNDKADEAAKEGSRLAPAPSILSLSSLKRWIKQELSSAAKRYWEKAAPQSYRNMDITDFPLQPNILKLPRPLLARLLAARSGHGDFADYHERFNHDDAHLLCRCGARKAPLHFFFCSIAKRRASRPPGPPQEVIPFLLTTPKGAKTLAEWLTETRFFVDICTRHPPP